jgi:hypothetical protein
MIHYFSDVIRKNDLYMVEKKNYLLLNLNLLFS